MVNVWTLDRVSKLRLPYYFFYIFISIDILIFFIMPRPINPEYAPTDNQCYQLLASSQQRVNLFKLCVWQEVHVFTVQQYRNTFSVSVGRSRVGLTCLFSR